MKTKYGIKSHDERFGTEEKCREFLIEKRWDGRPKCPQCGNNHMNYYLTTRKTWKCCKCKKQFSLKSNTILENSNLPLVTWFKAIYYFTTKKRGVSSIQLAEWLEIEQKTAWFLLHRLRTVLKEENNVILSGIVEADETEIGPDIKRDRRHQIARKIHEKQQEEIHGVGKKKARRIRGKPAKRGRKKGSTKAVLEQKRKEKELKGERIPYEQPLMIFGMTERKGKVVLKLLGRSAKSVTKASTYPHLKNHVTSSSILITDEHNMYDDTIELFSEHYTINHKKKKYAKGFIYTNTIENVWNHVKRTIDGTYFHLSSQHIEKYMDEFTFRWNRRMLSNLEKVDSFLDCLEGKKLKYRELISLLKRPYKIAG